MNRHHVARSLFAVVLGITLFGVSLPAPAQNIPFDTFRQTGGWKFANQKTPTMGWDTFQGAFDLGWTDYLNPVTYVMYFAGRGMASNGNCAGMCLLAIQAQDQMVVWAPFSGRIMETIYPLYPNFKAVEKDLNSWHWEQLSTWFIWNWAMGMYPNTFQTAQRIQIDIASRRYGMLCLSQGFSGHVVVPLKVVQGAGLQYTITVYDPNRPYSASAANPPLTVQVNNWSFPMGSSTWTGANGRLSYIPWTRTNAWRDLANGPGDILQIAFGADSGAEQITDGKGRKLFKVADPKGVDDLDLSEGGLGRDVVRMVRFGGGAEPRPIGPIGPISKDAKVVRPRPDGGTPDLEKFAAAKLAEYEREYGEPGEVYFVTNPKVKDLTIQAISRKAGAPVKMILGHRGQFLEVKARAADGKSVVRPDLTIAAAGDLSTGVSLRDRAGTSLKATFAHGLVQEDKGQIQVQRTGDLDAGKDRVSVSLSPAKALQVHSTGELKDVQVETQALDRAGRAKLGVNKLPVKKLQ